MKLSLLRRWWARLHQPSQPKPTLLPKPLPERASSTPQQDRIGDENTRAGDDPSINSYELFLLILQLAKRYPAEASNWIAELADALAHQDLARLSRLRSTVRSHVLSSVPHLTLEPSLADSERRHWITYKLHVWARHVTPVIITTLKGNREGERQLDDELTHLETILGLEAKDGIGPQALKAILVLVRLRVQQLVLELRDSSILTREMVEQALQETAWTVSTQLPAVLWHLEQGSDTCWQSRPAPPATSALDAVRPLISQARILQVDRIPEVVITELLEPALTWLTYSTNHVALMELYKLASENPYRNWELEELSQDADLWTQVAGAISESDGLLTWETCLALANARLTFHRYIDADEEESPWRVSFDINPAPDGSIGIQFAVAEQPMSAKFRRLFEEQDLAGRIGFLLRLVRYATTIRTSLLSVTPDDARKQVKLRSEDLWQTLTSERVDDNGPR